VVVVVGEVEDRARGRVPQAEEDHDRDDEVHRLVHACGGREHRPGGAPAVDEQGLRRARERESLGFIQLTLAVQEIGWTGGFTVA